VSRIRAGRLELEPAEADLGQIAAGAAERLSHELERAGCALRLELEPGVRGRWDASRVDQVVTNLLSNAAKYAPGAPVAVRVRRDGGSAVLEVEDAGADIAPEARERVFAAYERGASARSIGGVGLGLFIVRRIVDAHGGRVRVEAGASGGARFVVELPFGDEAAGALAATAERTEA